MTSPGLRWHPGHIFEDTLTEYVFSGFHYVPAALEAFLEESARGNGLPPAAFAHPRAIEPWPAWTIPPTFQRAISALRAKDPAPDRQTAKQSAQPDVIVRGEGWRLVVECELSKAYDAAQLLEHAVLMRSSHAEAGVEDYQLLLSGTLARPPGLDRELAALCGEFATRFEGLTVRAEAVRSRILWAGWGEVLRLFERLAADPALGETDRRILGDRVELLSRAGVRLVPPPGHALARAAARASDWGALETTLRRLTGWRARPPDVAAFSRHAGPALDLRARLRMERT